VTAAVGFLAASIDSADWLEDAWDSGINPDLWLYRKRTEAILRKFFRMSVEVGRLPSILGCEFFRTHVTSYSVSSFEDAGIFVHDVEHCVAKLDRWSQQLIARVILQGFSHEEAGRLMGCSRRTLERNLPDALDRLSAIFLAAGILEPVESPRASDEEACQEGEGEGNLVIV
jgi:DNA-directed RNA polymerase specialized sigma24 family protein